MAANASAVDARVARARDHGFRSDEVPLVRPFVAKSASHDDGPQHGMFFGGLGCPAFSRDLDGRFSRWHLEPGAHVTADVPACVLMVRWSDARGAHLRELCRSEVDDYHAYGLFPLWHEEFGDADLPFRVVLTSFSPLVPHREEPAALPAVVFDVSVIGDDGSVPAVDVALFWPNLNGWSASAVTTVDRGDRAWPGQHHAGNRNWASSHSNQGTAVIQGRENDLRGFSNTVGEVCISVRADTDQYSRQIQFKTDQNATGVAEHEQPYTFAAVRESFRLTGRLGRGADDSWPVHWHEPIGSAVAAHLPASKQHTTTRFVLTFDWPHVVFGQGRVWSRRYARDWPVHNRAAAMATHVQDNAQRWLAEIDDWHCERIEELTGQGWPPEVAGCILNETGLLTSLGTTWIEGPVAGYESTDDIGAGEHFGLLEGFDTGYFYVNTSDLWHYAFPAVDRTWPHLADLVFADLADAMSAEDPRQRPVYRPGERRTILRADRLPHDMGALREDPFVQFNGYSMRDDPNTWRDANPAFVLATLVHAQLTETAVPDRLWEKLCAASEIVAADSAGHGVPRHDEFGDSTWDNLGLRGWSTYTSGLCTGMWTAMAAHAEQRGEQQAQLFRRRQRAAVDVLESLWDGDHYRACDAGKYTSALMPDSLLGVFFADLAVGQDVVARQRIAQHLRSSYDIAFLQYYDGRAGPLLIAEPGLPRYAKDGGEELQVNEVLLGSGWMFTAMLRWYGMRDEAVHVATSLRNVLYGQTGLQYRTPAAVDGEGHFRAPLNLRPLAIWWLEVIGQR